MFVFRAPPATIIPLFVMLLAMTLAAIAVGDSGERGLRGVLVMRGDRVLDEENPRRLFTPGSVQKLLVTAAALHHLGPDHRIATRVTGTAKIQGGVLAGDLHVHGGGDPTWNRRFFPDDPRTPLRFLAAELRRRGLKRVTGALVLDTSRFPGRGWPISRPASELTFSYGAPTSALLVDESSVQVEIGPGKRIGEPGWLRPLAAATLFEWENQIVTVGRKRHEKGTVDFFPTWRGRKVVVRGEYPLSEPSYIVPVSVPHPDLFAAEVLRHVLIEEGINIDGKVRVDGVGAPVGDVLAELLSPPLSEILPKILRDSHNLYAETLLRVLAAEVQGEGRDDEGLLLVGRFLTDEVGLPEDSFHLDDASGLSPYNLLSPEAVVGLLRHARGQPWGRVYLGSLATPGKGTLIAWGRLPASLAAKTGTIRHSVALAGYLAAQDSEPVIFVAFLNHRTEERRALRADLAAWLRRF